MQTRDTTFKIDWVRKIIAAQEAPWAKMAYHQLPIKDSKLWYCNINQYDIRGLIKKGSFWRYLWLAWASVNYHIPVSHKDISTQIVWFNSHVGHRNKVIFHRKLYAAGVIYVRQFLDPTGTKWKTYDEFIIDNAIRIDFIKYNSVLQSIPKEWIKILKLKNMTSVASAAMDRFAVVKTKTWSNFAYKFIIEKSFVNNDPSKYE